MATGVRTLKPTYTTTCNGYSAASAWRPYGSYDHRCCAGATYPVLKHWSNNRCRRGFEPCSRARRRSSVFPPLALCKHVSCIGRPTPSMQILATFAPAHATPIESWRHMLHPDFILWSAHWSLLRKRGKPLTQIGDARKISPALGQMRTSL